MQRSGNHSREPTLNCNTNKTLNVSLLHNGRMNSEVTIVWNIRNFQLFCSFPENMCLSNWNLETLCPWTGLHPRYLQDVMVIAIIHSSTSLMIISPESICETLYQMGRQQLSNVLKQICIKHSIFFRLSLLPLPFFILSVLVPAPFLQNVIWSHLSRWHIFWSANAPLRIMGVLYTVPSEHCWGGEFSTPHSFP